MIKFNEFIREFEQVIEKPAGSLDGSESLSDMEGWDSMAMVAFIAMADSVLGANVTVKDLIACKNVSDLARLFPDKILM